MYTAEYIQILLRIVRAAKQIYRVTSTAFSRKTHLDCPHGNWPNYPTHAWWCDDCWNELKDAIKELDAWEEKEVWNGTQKS